MSQINKITGNYDRSTDSGKTAIEAELFASPLGSKVGDPRPGIAQNARPAQAIYFARNLSNKVERKVLRRAVSAVQRVPESVQRDYHMDAAEIQDKTNRGLADFNTYELAVDPIDKQMMFDSRPYIVRCSREKGKEGEWTPIPEGLYELYLGSYDRRNSSDEQVRREERVHMTNANQGRSIVFEEGAERGEWAYIEMRREEIKTAPVAADRERIYQGVAVEI